MKKLLLTILAVGIAMLYTQSIEVALDTWREYRSEGLLIASLVSLIIPIWRSSLRVWKISSALFALATGTGTWFFLLGSFRGAEVVVSYLVGACFLRIGRNRSLHLLHDATLRGKTMAVKTLLKSGAEVDVRYPGTEMTPLHWAAASGFPDVVDVLLNAGANVNARDFAGRQIIDTWRLIVARLQAERDSGRAVYDALCGSGITAKFAARGGADLVTTFNLAYYRMQGLSSMAGYLPIGDANAITLELGERSILNVVRECPVVAGLLGTDPTRNMFTFVDRIEAAGFPRGDELPDDRLDRWKFQKRPGRNRYGLFQRSRRSGIREPQGYVHQSLYDHAG